MKKSVEKRLEDIQNNGYELDFGVVLNDAIESYKKTFLWSGLAMLILIILVVFVTIGILGSVFGLEALKEPDMESLQFDFKEPLQIGIYITGMALLSGIMAPFTAGLLELPKAHDSGEDFAFDTVFKYYISKKIGPLFLLGFIISIIGTCVNMGNEFLSYPGFAVVNLFFNFLFGLFTILAIPFIIYANANPFEALNSSIMLVKSQFWIVCGLYIVAALAGLCGLLACCIGIVFTMPIMQSTIISIYKHSIGFHDNEKENDLFSREY